MQPQCPVEATHRPQVSILIRPSGRMQLAAAWAFVCSPRFQSSSGLLAGCNAASAASNPIPSMFQSSSGLLAGCNGGKRGLEPRPLHVSILIRPSGRMQQAGAVPERQTTRWFQSSSGLLAGCNGVASPASAPPTTGFNPHPAFWPDATREGGSRAGSGNVSILIRPSGRMQQLTGQYFVVTRVSVSILIRPSGRMQLRTFGIRMRMGLRFQSSSGLLAGCNLVSSMPFAPITVSILIRPSGRMQPNLYRLRSLH